MLFLPALLALACLVAVSMACALPTASRRAPYPPGGELHLQVDITDQFSHPERPDAQVLVRFVGMSEVPPADNASITCNGHDVTPRTQGFSSALDGAHPCPRQPPGGAYHIVYTDEHGASTSAVIPIPTGALAFRAPSDGGTFHFLLNQPLVISLAVPVPASGGSVTLNHLQLTPCGGGAQCVSQSIDPKAAYQSAPTLTAIASAIAVGVTQHSGECTIQLDNFSLARGPNTFSAAVDTQEPMQESGFKIATAIFQDTTDANFTAVADER
jgi:hypothetical protein